MTTHPVKAAGGRRSHVQAFEAIATGQPPRCAARTLEWLEWNGMIEKRFRIGKDVSGSIRSPMREIPIMPRRHTMSYASDLTITAETYIRERMFRFIAYCQTDDIHMRRIVRLIEHDRRTDEWAYSVSEPMLRAGFDEREVEYLAQHIARAFVAAFNRKRKEVGFVRA
jgi:hypothetical protein